MRLVILPRGWVMVGQAKIENNTLYLSNASVVRIWGTSCGLPELANKGPLKNTVLDGKCSMEFPMSSVIATIECNADAWKDY